MSDPHSNICLSKNIRPHYIVDYSDRCSKNYMLILVGCALTSIVFNNAFIIAATVCLVAFRNFWVSLGRSIGMAELAGAIASLQWLVGPMLAYTFGVEHDKYRMYVSSNDYFTYATPGTALFLTGMLAPIAFDNSHRRKCISVPEVLSIHCYFLLIVGVTSYILNTIVDVESFKFILFVLSNLRYVAAVLFIFSGSRLQHLVPFLIFLVSAFGARNSGMFHDVFLWGIIFVIFTCLKRQSSFAEKTALIAICVASVFLTLIIKSELRSYVWEGEKVSFSELAYDEIVNNSSYSDEEELLEVVVRINQGWIISRVLQQVPVYVPFANGETLFTALKSAFLPRFVAPNKKGAGGREDFTRFTRMSLGHSTSMGISVLGEAYVNFGVLGGCLLMFFYGVVFRSITSLIFKITSYYPLSIFFIPMIYLHAVKAETDLVTIINYIIKSSIICAGIVWLMSHQIQSKHRL